MSLLEKAEYEIQRIVRRLEAEQSPDGAWRFCFESGPMTDAYMILLLKSLEEDDEPLVRRLAERIASLQQPDGTWKLYPDDPEGHLSSTVEAYYALLWSGYYRKDDPRMAEARRFIVGKGGLARTHLLTKMMLALTGQYPWSNHFRIPLETILLPPGFPINLFDFSGYARVHIVPALIAMDRRFSIRPATAPDLSDLNVPETPEQLESLKDRLQTLTNRIRQGLRLLFLFPHQIHETARRRAEAFILERIEPDGTLYSYVSCTIPMIYALLALGYDRKHPLIQKAIRGLRSMAAPTDGHLHLQNATSTVWDTALLSHALQTADRPAEDPMVQKAARYLLSRQHRKYGDWAVHNPNVPPGGWGFSDINTINPDIDDTTAALRAIRSPARTDPAYRSAWQRGLRWLLSMQNEDGGWPSFEREADSPLLVWLQAENAEAATRDPSTPDLTGRTLEFLGNHAGLKAGHHAVDRAVQWLLQHQKPDGSWEGKWGIHYVYGTWAALTGLAAAGVPGTHPAVRKAARWLESVQNEDGGWGESCASDSRKRYVPLGASTRSQTAWAVDALLAVYRKATPHIERGVAYLTEPGQAGHWTFRYPTGAGLPGVFYSYYHSYNYIWPLLALGHYRQAAERE